MDPSYVSRLVSWQHNRYFATVAGDTRGGTSNQRSAIHVWEKNDYASRAVCAPAQDILPVQALVDLGTITTTIFQVIWIVGDYFVFLDKEFWVCSVELNLTRGSFRKQSAPAAPGVLGSTVDAAGTGSLDRRRTRAGGGSRATTVPVEATADPELVGTRTAGPFRVVRHLFVPSDWISLASAMLVGVSWDGRIIFARKSELAVVKRGLGVLARGQMHSRRAVGQPRGLPRRLALWGGKERSLMRSA